MWEYHDLHDAQDTNRMWSASGKSKYTEATEMKREVSLCCQLISFLNDRETALWKETAYT